jgi:hypothetical protein
VLPKAAASLHAQPPGAMFNISFDINCTKETNRKFKVLKFQAVPDVDPKLLES